MLDNIQTKFVSACSVMHTIQISGEYRLSLNHPHLLNVGTVVVPQLTFDAWGKNQEWIQIRPTICTLHCRSSVLHTYLHHIICELSITMQISHSPFGLTSY